MARLIGINHVALEVGDVERGARAVRPAVRVRAARPRARRSAFIDIGDQFLALSEGRCAGA